MKPLSTAWTQKLAGEKKADFEVIVRNSTLLLTRLKEILEEKENALLSLSSSVSDFEDPNWSHKQAYRNGTLTMLKEMKELLPF